MVSTSDRNQLKDVLIQAAFIVVFMVLIPLLIGFGASGFDSNEVLNLFQTYVGFGIAGIFIIVALFGVEILTKKGDSKYGNSMAFASPGEVPSLPASKFFKNRKLTLLLISIVIFGFIGLFVSLQGQTSFTGEVLVEQQFGPVGDISFRFFLVPLAENAAVGGLIASSIFLFRIFARKQNMKKSQFVILSIILITLVSGIAGVINHELRYGSTDLSVLTVFGFWAIGGLLTALSGSFIPFVTMHAANNLFFDLRAAFSADTTRIMTITVLTVLTVILVFRLFRRRGRRKDEG